MRAEKKVKQDFLDLADFDAAQLQQMLTLATKIKHKQQSGSPVEVLKGKILAMIFERESTRTRISFDVGMRQLGGQTIVLTGQEMQLSRDETIADTAQVISRYADAVMIRILSHNDLLELAHNARIPVINGLTGWSHPCQIMADIMTIQEHLGTIKGKKIAWVGDSNNVLTSWVQAAEKFDFTLNIATPKSFSPKGEQAKLIEQSTAEINHFTASQEAVKAANVVTTDTWISMGDKNAARRRQALAPFQVNASLMRLAKDDALFLHCLPAHRGEEVTDEVIDGPQSVVFDEAENRLHAQKGILTWCLADKHDIAQILNS